MKNRDGSIFFCTGHKDFLRGSGAAVLYFCGKKGRHCPPMPSKFCYVHFNITVENGNLLVSAMNEIAMAHIFGSSWNLATKATTHPRATAPRKQKNANTINAWVAFNQSAKKIISLYCLDQ